MADLRACEGDSFSTAMLMRLSHSDQSSLLTRRDATHACFRLWDRHGQLENTGPDRVRKAEQDTPLRCCPALNCDFFIYRVLDYIISTRILTIFTPHFAGPLKTKSISMSAIDKHEGWFASDSHKLHTWQDMFPHKLLDLLLLNFWVWSLSFGVRRSIHR